MKLKKLFFVLAGKVQCCNTHGLEKSQESSRSITSQRFERIPADRMKFPATLQRNNNITVMMDCFLSEAE